MGKALKKAYKDLIIIFGLWILNIIVTKVDSVILGGLIYPVVIISATVISAVNVAHRVWSDDYISIIETIVRLLVISAVGFPIPASFELPVLYFVINWGVEYFIPLPFSIVERMKDSERKSVKERDGCSCSIIKEPV